MKQTHGSGEAVKSLFHYPFSWERIMWAENIGSGWQSFCLTAWQLLVVRVRQTNKISLSDQARVWSGLFVEGS